MSRQARNYDSSKLKNSTYRATLTPDREPYVIGLGQKGLYLGFRCTGEGGKGTWTGRLRIDGVQHTTSFGGVTTQNNYEVAHKACTEWGRLKADGVDTGHVKTVEDVCNEFVRWCRSSKGAEGETIANKYLADFKNHVFTKDLGRMEVAKLRAIHIVEWRNALVSVNGKPMADTSKHKLLKSLRTALNYAVESMSIVSKDKAKHWNNVERVGTDVSRKVRFKPNEVQAILDASVGPIRDFFEFLSMLPIRPGALSQLIVEELRHKNGAYWLHIPKEKDKGAGKKFARKVENIKLSEKTANYLKKMAKDKLPKAPLFTDENGNAWSKDTWGPIFRDIRDTLKLDEEAVVYSFRHTCISNMVDAGMPYARIADIAGTSEEQISKHYDHSDADILCDLMTAAGF